MKKKHEKIDPEKRSKNRAYAQSSPGGTVVPGGIQINKIEYNLSEEKQK